jgi:hypothetical protein
MADQDNNKKDRPGQNGADGNRRDGGQQGGSMGGGQKSEDNM